MTPQEHQEQTRATLKRIKNYLEKRLTKNVALKQKNFDKNKGLSGFISYPPARETDAFYRGRIELLNQLIDKVNLLLSSEEIEQV